MATSSAITNQLGEASAAPPSCTLDEAGRHEQAARYRQLARTVVRLDRTAEGLLVEFGERLDAETLANALAVERDCCPLFVFQYEEAGRVLRVSVSEPGHVSALDAMAAWLGADAARTGG